MPRRLTELFPGLMLLLFTLASGASAAEYFVSRTGDDAADGQSEATAFATVQHGVEALEAGDTLTILPGEYREAVRREGLGSADAVTTIRAAIPGTVVLRGDVPAPRFEPVEGAAFVYAADFDAPETGVQAVNEQDTLTVMQPMPNITELTYRPGCFYYDAEQGRLYISTSDWASPDTHRYSVSVIATHGLHLAGPRRVEIEGITATGFNAAFEQPRHDEAMHATWGIFLARPTGCVIRDCYAYLNGEGIGINSRVYQQKGYGGNVIERCTAWGNASKFSGGDSGGITLLAPRSDTVRDSVSYRNAGYGINIYLGHKFGQVPANQSRLIGNLAWGNGPADVKIKTGVDDLHTTERTVMMRPSNDFDPIHCLVRRDREKLPPDSIVLNAEPDLDMHAEFADPDRHDYRLQSTSRFRGAAPDGSDRGPHPYEPNVMFVGGDGDDRNDGLAVSQAWQTLDHALKQLKPGDTLYLLPGRHEAPSSVKAQGTAEAPITIRGRGFDPVEITGLSHWNDCKHVVLERVTLTDPLRIAGGMSLRLSRVTFSAKDDPLIARGVTDLRVEHNAFASSPAITLRKTTGTLLRGNRFAGAGPALDLDDRDSVRYADYNQYATPDAAWQIGHTTLPLGALAPDAEVYSSTTSGGPMARAVGPDGASSSPAPDDADDTLQLTQPVRLHSVSNTTANFTWTTAGPATCTVAWGTSPDDRQSDTVYVDGFGSYSLTDLTPGEAYTFRITELSEQPNVRELIGVPRQGPPPRRIAMDGPPLTFSTAASPAPPRTYHVATDGNDRHTGTSAEQAWRTIAHAATRVNAGDTVLIAEGHYPERVRLHATGSPDAPITFAARPGERVVLTGAERKLGHAFIAAHKHHLRFDGLTFAEYPFQTGWPHITDFGGLFWLQSCRDIQITRCFSDGRGGYPAHFVFAYDTHDLLVQNSAAFNGMGGIMQIWRSPNARLNRFVAVRPMITSMVVYNTPSQPVHITNSILTDMLHKKAINNTAFFEVENVDNLHLDNNCVYVRVFPPDERHIFCDVNHAERAVEQDLTMAAFDRQVRATRTLFDNPLLVGDETPPDSYGLDRLTRREPLLITDFITTNSDLIERGIGLDPAEFAGGGERDQSSVRR